jgi:hypothetical protein
MPGDPLLIDDPDGRHPKVLVVNVAERLGVRPRFCNAVQFEATNQS